MRTRPDSPSTAVGWDAHAFPWYFPSLLPPCSAVPASSSPHHQAASLGSKKLKSPHLMEHVAPQWQPRPFPKLRGYPCSLHPAASSLNPPSPITPGSSTPQPTPAPPAAFTPQETRPDLPIAGSPYPCQPPATLLHATTSNPNLCPSASLLCPGACRASGLDTLPGLILGCSHKTTSKQTQSPVLVSLLSSVPSPSLSVPNSARLQPGPALHNALLPAPAASLAASHGIQASQPERLWGAAETTTVNTKRSPKR